MVEVLESEENAGVMTMIVANPETFGAVLTNAADLETVGIVSITATNPQVHGVVLSEVVDTKYWTLEKAMANQESDPGDA